MSYATPVWDRFTEIVEKFIDKAAVFDAVTSDSLSYGGLRDLALEYAAALSRRNELTVVLVGEPDVRALPLFLACAASSRCFVPLSNHEPVARLMEIIELLPSNLLIASANGLPNLEIVDLGEELQNTGLVWQELASSKNDLSDGLPFLVTHSSGSTGKPKAVAFSQLTKLQRTAQSVSLFDVSPDDIILSPTPLHHSLGQRHLMLAFMTGSTLVKAYPFKSDLWVDAVQKYQVTFAIPVATHLKILQSRILSDRSILNSFRCLVTSSAPAEPEFKRSVLNKVNFEFWEIYGMTETACVTAVRYRKGDGTEHLGRAVLGTNLRVSNANASTGGEIEIQSDCLSDGYWGEPERWKNSFTADGYFRSGDLGRLDENQNLIYLGRKNESFESGGLMIFPAEVENIISELNGILDCVAFGLPDKIFGHVVSIAFVGSDDLTQRQIIQHARIRLPKHMWPTRLFQEKEFPLLSSGKVDRRKLASKYSSL